MWKLSDSRGKAVAKLRQPLYGHTAPVLCMAVSSAFNILVSGSVDQTCIIWDLSRLRYVTQLANHKAPVAAIAVNNLTGAIASCASSWLYLWSVNGELLASVDTASTGIGSLQINCVCMSEANEWDTDNVIITGSSDGVTRMWSVELIKQSKSPFVNRSKLASRANEQTKSLDHPELASLDSTNPMTSVSSASEEYVDLSSDALLRSQSSSTQSVTSSLSVGRPVPTARYVDLSPSQYFLFSA